MKIKIKNLKLGYRTDVDLDYGNEGSPTGMELDVVSIYKLSITYQFYL